MLEQQKQQEFFQLITGENPIESETPRSIKIYKKLVYNRFYDVISHAFPLTKEIFIKNEFDKNKLNKEIFEELIREFIKNKTRTPYIWTMPNDFRKFLLTQELIKDHEFIDDLMWYEWTEIELFMQPYTASKPDTINEQKKFSWDFEVKLSLSASMRNLEYKVYLEQYTKPGNYPVILYYDFEHNRVHYREISSFIETFIKNCEAQAAIDALHQTIKQTPTLNNVGNDDSILAEFKQALQPVFAEFVKKHIFVIK